MKRLWAPWRMEYILDDKKHDVCLFCDVSKKDKNRVNKTRDRKNLILHRGKKSFIMLNKYPYNSGHVMVVPYFHTSTFEGLSDDVLYDLIKNVEQSTRILKEVLNPDGFNMGLNFGKVAGAGMESHMHIHVVPRWTGDTDSMPIIAETRVMPEHLRKTYNKLVRHFQK
ncbi:MAG: HIT domain-containing protein [Nitrospiraceae bacterium]|nr:MAG: HIT domain-containing protein [Nitrospiraceae bacterium]UCH46280.1 MAG: HIT domain-containing protein [Nitrospiraceae bacterium]